MSLEAARIGARKRKPIRTKRVPIDLAKIIADLAGARVGVLELQNRLRNLARHRAHLDGAAVVGGEVGLGVGARAGGELLDGAAVGHAAVVFALAADVEVDGEGAVIAHVRLALCAGGGVDCVTGVPPVTMGAAVTAAALASSAGAGAERVGTAKYPMDTRVAMMVAGKCIVGMVVFFL